MRAETFEKMVRIVRVRMSYYPAAHSDPQFYEAKKSCKELLEAELGDELFCLAIEGPREIWLTIGNTSRNVETLSSG